jgi:hypothetical protein
MPIAKDRPTDDFESPWKDALSRYFPEFLAFYFPLAHACIDWRQPHRFLDEELAQVVRDAQLSRHRVDRLVEVATRDAGPQWVYIHVEVRGQPDPGLAERLFVYHWTAIMELERTTNMRYVTSVERIGREEGRKEGRLEGEAVLLRRQLLHRFGAVPAWAETRLKGASTEQLEAWGERVLDATTLDDVFGPER